MRKLNRVIAAGALAVPMALGASGIAVAAEGSSEVQNQVGAAESNGSGSEENILDLGNRDGDSDNEDNFLEEFLQKLLGDEDNSENDSLFGGNDEDNSGSDSSDLLGIS